MAFDGHSLNPHDSPIGMGHVGGGHHRSDDPPTKGGSQRQDDGGCNDRKGGSRSGDRSVLGDLTWPAVPGFILLGLVALNLACFFVFPGAICVGILMLPFTALCCYFGRGYILVTLRYVAGLILFLVIILALAVVVGVLNRHKGPEAQPVVPNKTDNPKPAPAEPSDDKQRPTDDKQRPRKDDSTVKTDPPIVTLVPGRPADRRITIRVRFFLGAAQADGAGTLRIGGQSKGWRLDKAKRETVIDVTLSQAGDCSYELETRTTVVANGRRVTLQGKGKGTINAQAGSRYACVNDTSAGVNPFRCVLRPE